MIAVVPGGNTLLSYALNVTPSPLQASLTTAETLATLQIIAVNQSGSPVTLQSLSVAVQVGSNASDLTPVSTTALTANIQPDSDWELSPVTLGGDVNTYQWVAEDSTITLDEGESAVITFTSVPINTEIGTTTIAITETLPPPNPHAPPTNNYLQFQVTKFPFGFYFTGLAAYGTSSDSLKTQVPYSGKVKLKWTGSLTDASGYKVFYSTNAGQVSSSVSTLGQWTSPPLTNNAVFLVQATANDAAGNPVVAELVSAVTVQNPDIVASSLSVGGQTINSFDQILPAGSIVMWSGSLDAIPAGWALCDGNNGTPDLVSRFIFGAGSQEGAYAPGATSGTASHTHVATAAVIVSSAGDHTHDVNAFQANTVNVTSGAMSDTLTTSGSVVVAQVNDATAASAGSHTHPATATVTVQSASNMPPFYALAFIMKTQ